MSDFVWIIPVDKQASLGIGGVSPTYIVPKHEMNSNEHSLPSRILWIVLRSVDDRYIAAVTISRVERFIEGYYSGDFLIHSDLYASLRLSTSFEDAKQYSTLDLKSLPSGITPLSESDSTWIKTTISRNVVVRLAQPSSLSLKAMILDVLPKQDVPQVKAAISHVVQSLTLDSIWGSGIGHKLNPIGNFAAAILSKTIEGPLQTAAVDALKSIDPLVKILRTIDAETVIEAKQSIKKSVDLSFTEIEPDKIYAREFIASDNPLHDLESALNKTGVAEKIHQSMLRDIVIYLQRNGIQPFESTSVDLMFKNGQGTRFYEIKSSTIDNIIAQASKGAFQIACYANAMKNEFAPLESALIMHSIREESLKKFTMDALDYLGIKCLIYDPDLDWPDRVKGLLA
jgi:hypothetical protein